MKLLKSKATVLNASSAKSYSLNALSAIKQSRAFISGVKAALMVDTINICLTGLKSTRPVPRDAVINVNFDYFICLLSTNSVMI